VDKKVIDFAWGIAKSLRATPKKQKCLHYSLCGMNAVTRRSQAAKHVRFKPVRGLASLRDFRMMPPSPVQTAHRCGPTRAAAAFIRHIGDFTCTTQAHS
jgi:hypothetical protein